MNELAVDVAILLPPDVRRLAIDLNAALPEDASHDLRLDNDHHPHLTLTQAFLRAEELDAAFERVDEALRAIPPLAIDVTGGGESGRTLWLAIARGPDLVELHEHMMEALRGFERPGGTPAAFVDGDGRVGDVLWVTGYRLKSAFHAFTPHITLGYGDRAPEVEPFTFTADTVAACHLGRFCTCRRVLRAWELTEDEDGLGRPSGPR